MRLNDQASGPNGREKQRSLVYKPVLSISGQRFVVHIICGRTK